MSLVKDDKWRYNLIARKCTWCAWQGLSGKDRPEAQDIDKLMLLGTNDERAPKWKRIERVSRWMALSSFDTFLAHYALLCICQFLGQHFPVTMATHYVPWVWLTIWPQTRAHTISGVYLLPLSSVLCQNAQVKGHRMKKKVFWDLKRLSLWIPYKFPVISSSFNKY